MDKHEVYYIMNNEGDWCGLYVDGELYHEGHDAPVWVWLQLINELGFRTTDAYDEHRKLGEFLAVTGGRYPQSLDDLTAIMGEEE